MQLMSLCNLHFPRINSLTFTFLALFPLNSRFSFLSSLPLHHLWRMSGQPQLQSVEHKLAVPACIAEIAPILCVADEVQPINPRIGYLCRFYAFEKSHRLDPTSSGAGVRPFKTVLLQRLQRDNGPTLLGRKQKSDAREMQIFYQHYYTKYIQPLENATAADETICAQLIKAYQTANVLLEVLKAVSSTEATEVDHKILEAEGKAAETTQICAPSNMLRLGYEDANQNIPSMTRGEDTDENQGDQSLREDCNFKPSPPPSPTFKDSHSNWDYFSPSLDGQSKEK